ncbi:MAG: hypothetical protein DDT22_00234 [candidate division WS2 bacterium]|nr:hypothetical protein [Candidatus Lithacetigena glycinireducens]
MKIYIASSWKNSAYLIDFANLLRKHHHEVDLFCGESDRNTQNSLGIQVGKKKQIGG